MTVSVEDLDQIGAMAGQPLVLVDLAAAPRDAGKIVLPAVPVVGLGDPAHPLAPKMDTVIDCASEAEKIAIAAAAQPIAAATLIHVLRALPSLSLEDGLALESLAYATLQGSAAHRDWIARQPPSGPQAAPGALDLRREDDVVIATLDRPAAGNAIDRPLRDALHEAFQLVNMDPTIARFVLRGRGKAFSLGADLAEFGTTTDPATAHMIRCATLPAREAARCADRFEVEIDGACVGAGLELSAFARRVTATRRSWFQLPELAMGVIPGAGGCVSLTRRIGRQATARMVLSGARVSAREALSIGLVDALVD